jgi:hypothetical protein
MQCRGPFWAADVAKAARNRALGRAGRQSVLARTHAAAITEPRPLGKRLSARRFLTLTPYGGRL